MLLPIVATMFSLAAAGVPLPLVGASALSPPLATANARLSSPDPVREALVGDGRLDFQLGVWRIAGSANTSPTSATEIRGLLACDPWSDGLVHGLARRYYADASRGENANASITRELAAREPDGVDYTLWDARDGCWHLRPGWLPGYDSRPATFEVQAGSVLVPEYDQDDTSGPHRQRSGFEAVDAEHWTYFVERRWADGVWRRICELKAERVDAAFAKRSEPVRQDADAAVTTLLDEFYGSRALAIDEAGNLYFGGRLGEKGDVPLLRVTPDGKPGVLAEGVNPAGVVWRNGQLYVHAFDRPNAGGKDGWVVRLNASGELEDVGLLDGDPLAVDPRGHCYSIVGPDVLRLIPGEEPEVWVSDPLLAGGFGICWDDARDALLVGIWKSGRIYAVRAGAAPEYLGTIPGSEKGRCAWLAMDGADVLATSFGGERVYRLDPSGVVTLVAGSGLTGGADGPAERARFENPNGIAVGGDGRDVYVLEIRPGPWGPFGHGRLRRIRF